MARRINDKQIKKRSVFSRSITEYPGDNRRSIAKSLLLIVEGRGENKYFSQIKNIHKLGFDIIGGNKKDASDSMSTEHLMDVQKAIINGLANGMLCYYVVDLDRLYIDKIQPEKKAYYNLKMLYQDRVVFCDSMPSFEFWLLLHFPQYRIAQYTQNGQDEKDLEKFIPNYKKTEVDKYQFLYKDENIQFAYNKANRISTEDDSLSHTNVWKLMKDLNLVKTTIKE